SRVHSASTAGPTSPESSRARQEPGAGPESGAQGTASRTNGCEEQGVADGHAQDLLPGAALLRREVLSRRWRRLSVEPGKGGGGEFGGTLRGRAGLVRRLVVPPGRGPRGLAPDPHRGRQAAAPARRRVVGAPRGAGRRRPGAHPP